MTEKRITAPEGEAYDRALQLYSVSFPLHEQRLPADQAAVLCETDYHFTSLWDGETFCGLVLYWERPSFIYVEHFAIEPCLRGGGYGTSALRALCSQGKSVILEIDPPVDEVSRRRLRFYERAGFVQNSFEHVHPPYRPGFSGHALCVLSCPHALDKDLYTEFFQYLRDTVMAHGKK